MNLIRTVDPPALHRVRLEDVRPQPWRNGGGTTQELLTWPADAAWQWRVSVARIDRDGPFSAFPGVQRWFTVLQGQGVALTLPQGELRLRAGDAPLCFDGADAPHCRLLNGATVDLNVMARSGTAQLRTARAGDTLQAGAAWRGLYCATPAVVAVGGQQHHSTSGELLWAEAGAQAAPWHLERAGQAWWLEFWP